MKKHFKIILLTLAILFGTFQLPQRTVSATTIDCDNRGNDIPAAVWEAAGCGDDNGSSTNPNESPLTTTAIKIINGIIAVLSIIAVIFIIYGGIQYMTSTGDSGKTKKAKDTILYAAIGLIVCSLAAALVNFVVVNLLGNSTSEGSSSSQSESQSSSQSGSQSNSQQDESTPQNSSSPEEETEPDDVTPINTTTPLIQGEGITFKDKDNNCLIKGNISKTKFDENGEPEKIYHLPGQRRYAETKIEEGEQYFCTEQDAIDAGFRLADSEFKDEKGCTIKAYTNEYDDRTEVQYYILPGQFNYDSIDTYDELYCSISSAEEKGYKFNTIASFSP